MSKYLPWIVIAGLVICLCAGCGGGSPASEESSEQTDYADTVLNANNKMRQTLTVENIQRLGVAVEQAIMQNSSGSPKAGNIEELEDLLNEMEIVGQRSLSDGWGNSLVYEADMAPGSRSYRIISYGADGAPGPKPQTPGVVTRFEEDIIYANGDFVQSPEGSKK